MVCPSCGRRIPRKSQYCLHCGAFAAAFAGGIVGVVSFFIGIPGPLYGVINVDLALMIAYLVSAAALVIFSSLDKNGKKVRA